MDMVQVGESSVVTEHALLVPLGHFAARVGVLDAFAQVPFAMKTVAHRPADKLAELFCHIVAGGMHVNALARSAHPLVQDQAVARAWGQDAFASASGVNALLRKATPTVVTALQAALRPVLAPYRQRLLSKVSPGWIVVDLDLTGLVVSDQAMTYEGAEFGSMGELGRLGKGYQFARAQLVTQRDALVLGGFLHPGRTASPQCLTELVGLIEATVGRPRRRAEAVAARREEVRQQLAALEAQLARWAADGGPRRSQARREATRDRLRAELRALDERVTTLAAENAANPHPRRIILRLDGGFGDGEHLAWLYEQGYAVVARVHRPQVARMLRPEDGLAWAKVSKNGFIAQSQRTRLGICPYPVRLFACKQWRGEARPERWSALVATPDLAEHDWPARRVGVFYNGRQVMEAGIKETKGIFASRHLPTRQQAGIALYQELVLLAQNLMRWFRRQALGNTILAAAGIQELVQIGARSRAVIEPIDHGRTLTFLGAGPWQGLRVALRSPFDYQLALPGFDLLMEASP